MVTKARTREVGSLLRAVADWGAAHDDVVAVALVGSWARGAARHDSDVDVVVLTAEPERYTDDDAWIETFAAGATVRTGDWGAVVERRLRLRSGLEVEVGIGRPSWAKLPPDEGTRRVVRDGLRSLHDPTGLLERLVSACDST